MRLLSDVDPVDLDEAVAGPQSGGFGHRSGVHFADVLPGFVLIGQQVETETVLRLALDHVTQTRHGRLFHNLHQYPSELLVVAAHRWR